MARRNREPTDRERAILRVLVDGGALEPRIPGTRHYQLCTGYDGDGNMVDMVTVAEARALHRAGWITERESGDEADIRGLGCWLASEAGSDAIAGAAS
jgi:hypothetical protein